MLQFIKKIKDDAKRLGIRENGNLLVHASLRSLGEVPGGAETVIQGLLAALGDDGTLLMPALSYATVNADNPVFDVLNTPSCVGALPEYFRKRKGTLRSVHPTHSVCGAGCETEFLLNDHRKDTTPCGPNSPYRKLSELGGQILFIGCGMSSNTSMHAVEELVEQEYLFRKHINYKITLSDGSGTTMRVKRHDFTGWNQAYSKLQNVMGGDSIRVDKILEAECHLIDVKSMWRNALEALSRDPFYFVEKDYEDRNA